MNVRLIVRSHHLSTAGILVAAVIAVLAAGVSTQTTVASLTILSKEGRKSVPVVITGDQELVGLDDLTNLFQLSLQESLGAITVSYKGRTIVLTPDQTLASVAGRLISLPAPPTRGGRRWLVPLEFISRALAPIYDLRLDLRKPSHLLIVGDLRVPTITVRYDPLGASGRLTIDATPRANSTVGQDNDHITVKFDADAIDAANSLLPPQGSQSLIQGVRVSDPLALLVDLGPRFGGFKAAAQPVDGTMRLVIDVTSAQTDAPATPPAPTPPPELPPAFTQPVSPVRTIAVDPGHGGDDEGAKGAGGAKEKDLTLAIARRAKALIEARLGIRVLLTREDDRNVPTDDRTAIANNNKADLFVSVHANSSMRSTATGASVFCAAFEGDLAQPVAGAGAERLPTFGGGSREIELVPWDLAQTRHLDRSTAFAVLLQQQMRERIPLAAHPIDRAPLRVLESANMPAVLVELGFLSNAEQERLLTSEPFQATFVQALYEAIVKFRDSLVGTSEVTSTR